MEKFLHPMIIIKQIFCVIGIITNLILLSVVVYKPNRKDLKENQYKYMALNALLNILVCVIVLTHIMSECDKFYSVCFRVRSVYFVQYFRMIVGEYLCNALRLMSALSYVWFSINRLSLIGKDHSKFVVKVSKMSIKGFLLRFFLPCLILPVVKIFRFLPNTFQPDLLYPNPIVYHFNFFSASLILVYLSFDVFFDFINNVLFLLINLIVDVILVVSLKETIKEKEKKSEKLQAGQNKK